jgi:hypothetical protein
VEVCTGAADITGAKAIADVLRYELGFINTQAFADSSKRGELLVGRDSNGEVVGFARFHHRRDRITTLYEIGVARQGAGLGGALIGALEREASRAGSLEIRVKCPIDLPANEFYSASGYAPNAGVSLNGRKRRLMLWTKTLPLPTSIAFVASFTSSTNDLTKMIGLWEQVYPGRRPFEHCIFTPLFTDPGALAGIRHIHNQWGVGVLFDSGGFFVQQGKIEYEDLYAQLLDFYHRNSWADAYVLPDFVPTSKHSEDEVWERVQVTAREGVRFFDRIPSTLRQKALGVLQGRSPEQLEHCYAAYRSAGIDRIGFGSFDTKGGNDEINLVTDNARLRLQRVEAMLRRDVVTDRSSEIPRLHLFGVGTPRLVVEFGRFGASSFDSSGWQRTAGYGNVYLPFMPRRNVTHGGSSIAVGTGLDAAAYYRLAEDAGHSCAFCADFSRLQSDRFYRMWHNAIVYREMVDKANGSFFN